MSFVSLGASRQVLIVSQGLFTWREVVPGRRVTLSPEPSFTERLYEKVVPVDRAKTWPSRVRACSICLDLYLVGETTIAKVFIWKEVGAPPGSPYLQSE